jgi:hypothetical protein
MMFFVVAGAVGMSYSPLGRAIARRIGGEPPADVKALREEVDALRAELADAVERQAAQLEEAHSRLDFAERMLAQVRERGALPGAPQ